ncbi:hypothetical protein [Primorskyibacter sp. S87]|uniref:hypothetical protein n=1 Tax=Primorskyibacter sp. S87 TaxID=3415126 RepID=UPI003C7E96A3
MTESPKVEADTEVDAKRWASVPYWTWEEAEYLLVGLDHWKVKNLPVDLPLDLKDLQRRQVRDALEFEYRGQDGPRQIDPVKALEIAKRLGIAVPEHLADEVAKLGVHTPPSNGVLGKKPVAGDGGLRRSYNKLLKATLAMAIAQYQYQPKATRQSAIKQIVEDAEDMGIKLDDETVRNRLREAFDVLTADEQARVEDYLGLSK